MSLFGNLGQSRPQTSSVFGTANTTSAQTGLSLFGTASSASQPQQSAGPFSGLNPSAQAQPTSLLSGLGTSQAPQQQQPATGGGMFGNLGASTSQPPQSTGSNLFGPSTIQAQTSNTTAQQQQGQTQTAGGPLSQSTSGNPQSAYFESLLERGRKRNNQADGSNQFGELPSLQLGLGDIARKVRNLGTGGPSAQLARDSRAHYLLAASGVSTGSALRDLHSFSAQAGIPAAPPSGFDTDLEAYISNLRSQSTLDLIAEGLEQSKRDFDMFLEENVQMEWDAQRRRIFEHFGLVKKGEDLPTSTAGAPSTASPAERGAFGRSSRRGKGFGASSNVAGMSFGASGMRSVIGTPGPRGGQRIRSPDGNENSPPMSPPEDRVSRVKQEKLAEKVKALNTARLQEVVYPVLKQFAAVENLPTSNNSDHLIDAYKALIEITGENPNVQQPTDRGAVRERQYAPDYLDEAHNSPRSIAIRKRIIDGSRRYLEKQFFRNLEQEIIKHPKDANLGGIPTVINKVRAYIRVRSARKELGAENIELQMLGDDYCWVLIFYLLRSGKIQEAAQYVAENERAIRTLDRNFPLYMAGYAKDKDRRLPPELQNRINSEYQQRARIAPENSIDPYRMACYKIVGRCELSKRILDGINQGMEDWVWLQFNLAREVNRVEEAAGEVWGLDEVRRAISEIGQRHFQSTGSERNEGFGVFFFLQILGGMFEQAVAYLYRHSYTSAVHFAIALAFYGLLRVSDFRVAGTEILTFTTNEKPQLNFSYMLGGYTRDFRAAKAEAAADYLTLICLNADLPGQLGKAQADTCHEALRELILETREFAELLGDIRSDGQRVRGAIEQRLELIKLADQREFLNTVTTQAAQVADDSGRYTDAVLLYHLAEEYDKVLTIINRIVSDAIAVDLGEEPMKLQPLKPRVTEAGKEAQLQKQSVPSTSLSLTSVDDPFTLARNMISLYDTNAMYYGKIRAGNRETATILMPMIQCKEFVLAGNWPKALDHIYGLNLLPPFNSPGNISAIRQAAQNFGLLPTEVQRNIGNLLVWAITALAKHRESLLSTQYDDRGRKELAESLLAAAKDLMVFAGLLRYKLPPRVFEALAKAGQDLGPL